MKKLLMVALFAIVAVGASAQKNWTIWWGGNVANITDADSEFKALNIGVSYTAPIADAFDWSAGVSYTTKGAKGWDPGFISWKETVLGTSLTATRPRSDSSPVLTWDL